MKITVEIEEQAAVTLHMLVRRVEDMLRADPTGGHAADDVRDVKMALGSALRAHGWQPCGDGQWQQAAPRHSGQFRR